MQSDEIQTRNEENASPDWAVREKDLCCPLCEYNLRGLTEPRCPECGFKFTWQELLDAEKNKHPYLFEYGKGRNIKTFWKTCIRAWRPRRFWREVNPAQEVRWTRLIVYWLLSSSLLVGIMLTPSLQPIWNVGQIIYSVRGSAKPVPGRPGFLQLTLPGPPRPPFVISATSLDDFVPPPWRMKFWTAVLQEMSQNNRRRGAWDPQTLLWCMAFIAWPVLTLITLQIFRVSMRQAKIKTAHLFRTVIYSCDFGWPVLLLAVGSESIEPQYQEGWLWPVVAVASAMIAMYRLTIAFRLYLRVHLPLATVLASQVIAFLFGLVVLVQIAEMWWL